MIITETKTYIVNPSDPKEMEVWYGLFQKGDYVLDTSSTVCWTATWHLSRHVELGDKEDETD